MSDDELARWLIMTGQEWHWFPQADAFERIVPVAIAADGSYPVSVDMGRGQGPDGADSVQGFLRDGWINGSYALLVLKALAEQHQAEVATLRAELERKTADEHARVCPARATNRAQASPEPPDLAAAIACLTGIRDYEMQRYSGRTHHDACDHAGCVAARFLAKWEATAAAEAKR